MPTATSLEHVDVLIVGAGISGIGAAYHVSTKLPHKTYAILEGRDAIGGTWDLFRYPGIRSDSDLHTFGYAFKPWTADKAIADAGAILDASPVPMHIVSNTASVAEVARAVMAAWTVTGGSS